MYLVPLGVVYLKISPGRVGIPWINVLPIGTVRHLVGIPPCTRKLWYSCGMPRLLVHHTKPLLVLVVMPVQLMQSHLRFQLQLQFQLPTPLTGTSRSQGLTSIYT